MRYISKTMHSISTRFPQTGRFWSGYVKSIIGRVLKVLKTVRSICYFGIYRGRMRGWSKKMTPFRSRLMVHCGRAKITSFNFDLKQVTNHSDSQYLSVSDVSTIWWESNKTPILSFYLLNFLETSKTANKVQQTGWGSFWTDPGLKNLHNIN